MHSPDEYPTDFPIPSYDELHLGDILPLLPRLDPDELEVVRLHEAGFRARVTLLRRIHQLQTGSGVEPDPETATLSLTDAAKVLGIHRSTAYDHARNGTFPIPIFRVGSLLKVNKAQLESYIQGGTPATTG